MNYDPKTKKFPYPEDTSSHYIDITMDRGLIFDKNYPYLEKSFPFRFKRFWVRFLLVILVFPVARIRMGIGIKGKSVFKRYKYLLKDGAITVANHVHFWDYICVMKALHHNRWPNVIVWDKNINGKDGPLMRLVGGIPIPVNDNEATLAFISSLEELFKEKGWLHIYPEGSMWEYYRPIRPFKTGAAAFAIKYDKPIIPMAFTYRKPNALRRKLFKQIALFDLHIGEPLFVNKDLPKTKQLEDLTIRLHDAVRKLAGLSVEDNFYPQIYNNSKRVDYY